MAEQEKDRTEPATPFKLEEARRRGQVAKSLDFISLVMLAALLAALYAWSERLAAAGCALAAGALERAAVVSFSGPDAAAWLGQLTTATLSMLAPFLAVAVLAALVANLVQTGPVFSAFPLKPDFNRINPATGFKRVFSLKTLVEAGKTLVKLAAFAGVAWLALAASCRGSSPAWRSSPGLFRPAHGRDHGAHVQAAARLGAARAGRPRLQPLGLRPHDAHEPARDEGGGQAPRRRSAREGAHPRAAARGGRSAPSPVKRLPEADVLITNPTHFAVAARLRARPMRAPNVVAKGAGELALELRARAARLGLPIVEDQPLARRLFAEVEARPARSARRCSSPVARVTHLFIKKKQSAPCAWRCRA
jgi:flagellar biosynthetic protein FlhB